MSQVSTSMECSPLASSTCKDILLQLKQCLPDESEELYVNSDIDQGKTEVMAMTIISGLNFLNPSPNCLEMAEPFLCLYLFPLCDATNSTYRPTYNECVLLTTDICQREWQMAVQLSSDLPKCSEFEDAQSICSNSTFVLSHSNLSVFLPQKPTHPQVIFLLTAATKQTSTAVIISSFKMDSVDLFARVGLEQ